MNLNWDWASHLPVLKFFVNEYDIAFAVEHGTGIHSTPILLQTTRNYIGYEENETFQNEMIADGLYSDHDVLKLEVPEGVEMATRYSDYTDKQKKELEKYYNHIRSELNWSFGDIHGFRLLFIDGFLGTRNSFFNKMYDLFDIIIIHDTEPGSYENEYQYTFKSDKFKELFNIYSVTTPVPYTSLMIRKYLPIDFDILRKYMNEYCDMLEWEHDQMDILIH